MSGTTLSYATSVRISEAEEMILTLPVETADERLIAAGEVCARIVWPLEHEVAGVESIRIRPNGLEVRLSDDLNRSSAEAGIFHVLSWVLGSSNITRVPETV